MAERSAGRLIRVVIVWIVIAAVLAVSYKYVVSPLLHHRDDRAKFVEQYEHLAQTARERGITPEPLPEDADVDGLRTMIAALSAKLTGSAPPVTSGDHSVRLALDAFSGYAVFRSEQFKRDLSAHGVQIELIDDGADYPARIRTLASGETPLAVFTIDALLTSIADLHAAPGTIVMLIDETIGADAMVAYESAVPNIDALNRKDARFVVTPASPSETLARTVLANFDLDRMPDKPWIEANGAEDVYNRFRKADRDQPQAFVLWEPYLSKALEQRGAHVLLDSSQFRGYIVDVLVAQRQYLLDHEDIVRLVIESYLRTAYEANRSGQLDKLLADDARASGERLSSEQVERLAKGIWFKNTRENYAHMAITDDQASQQLQRLDLMIGNINAVLQRTGGIKRDPTNGKPHTLYYDGIFRKLYASDFHPALIRPADGQSEAVRLRGELPELDDQQWQQLAPVGTLRVDQIVFARGTATLTHQSELALNRLVETLQSWPQYYLLVQGHARHEGDVDANRRLAADRATAARQYIVGHGIAPHRVKAVSTEPSDRGGQAQSVSFVLGQAAY